jgi:hypothetical protein
MPNKSCIVFACTILSHDRLHTLDSFLSCFKNHFSESDIYIGINYNSISELEDYISNANVSNIKSISRGNENLYAESDASAYQIALKDLYNSKNEYENYWFVHTKGAVNSHSDYLRNWYVDNFLSRRNEIEDYISNNEGIGSYAMLGLEYDFNRVYDESDCEISLFENTLSDSLPCTHANFFYIHTIYVINKAPMQAFFNLISDTWFTTKLNRYYFEGVFPFIVSRLGYFPYIENRYSCNGHDLEPYVEKWIDDNSLEQYRKYVNTFKTNYTFNQLTPPYVNSNT